MLLVVVTISFQGNASAQTTDTAALISGRPVLNVSFRSPLDSLQSKDKKKKSVFEWKDHPTLRAGIVEVALRARLQLDSQSSDAAIGNSDETTADIAKRRIGIEGSVGKFVEFQLERELSDSEDPWRDVFVNYRQFEQIQFQYGKFKLPFGLDQNTGATNLDFAYRSLIAETLAPGRDRGYMVHGGLLKRTIRYEFGKFEHDGRNAKPKKTTRNVANQPYAAVYGQETTVGHLFAMPLRTLKGPAKEFEVGVAWTSSDLTEEGLSGIRGKTVFGQTFFSNDYFVLGQRKRLGFETRWRPGPFSFQAEYSRLTDERRGESVEDSDLSEIRGRGWYVSGTWAVTGDNKADGLDATKHPLFRGGIGAVEVAARLERLTFDSTAAPNGSAPSTSVRADIILGNSDKILTFGTNWYLNRWVKLQFNLIQETLTDPEQGPLPTQPSFWSRVLRFQFTL